MIGTLIADRYRIDAPLGAGGMGTVYRATDERLGRPVALKLLVPELGQDAEAIARFQREARASARITHPGIVQIHDFGATPAASGRGMASYLVMELAEGETLARMLARGPLAPSVAISLGLEVLAALSAAHGAGIVHRDLKPENVMITRAPDGQLHAKLLDFGLAQIKSGTAYARLTQTGAILGTPRYMAPEQARAEPCDARTDVYGAGLVLYAALAGRAPFDAESIAGVVSQVLEAVPPRLDVLVPGMPPAVASVIETAIQKRPDQRFASAQAFASALEQARASSARISSPAAYAATAIAPGPVAPPARSSRLGIVVGAIGVLGVGAAVVLAFFLGESRSSSASPSVSPPSSLSPSLSPPSSLSPPLSPPSSLSPSPSPSLSPSPSPSLSPPPSPPHSTHLRAHPTTVETAPPPSTTSAPPPPASGHLPECEMAARCCVFVGGAADGCARLALLQSDTCVQTVASYHHVLELQHDDNAARCHWP